jgi:hypothetical protein
MKGMQHAVLHNKQHYARDWIIFSNEKGGSFCQLFILASQPKNKQQRSSDKRTTRRYRRELCVGDNETAR